MLAEADLIALVRHADDDAGPGVEPAVDQSQLWRGCLDEYGGQGGSEAAASGVQFHQLSIVRH
jgi:hypothetical protein